MSNRLATLIGAHLGVELMVSNYRHAAIGFVRVIKGIVVRRAEMEVGEGVEEGNDKDEEATMPGPRWE